MIPSASGTHQLITELQHSETFDVLFTSSVCGRSFGSMLLNFCVFVCFPFAGTSSRGL